MKIFNRFHRVAKKLEKRYNNRETIVINDEYDTQDLLYGLISVEFDSIQAEEYGPRFTGKRSRIDFFLKLENIGIEVKKVRDKDHAKKLNEEIIIDKEYYSNNPNINQLYFFIYDPNSLLLIREDFLFKILNNFFNFIIIINEIYFFIVFVNAMNAYLIFIHNCNKIIFRIWKKTLKGN